MTPDAESGDADPVHDHAGAGFERIFVEVPAGSLGKLVHDEDSFDYRHRLPVSKRYPWSCGFLPHHVGADDRCIACYPIPDAPVAASPDHGYVAGLLEFREEGEANHKILLPPADEPRKLPTAMVDDLVAFVRTQHSLGASFSASPRPPLDHR
jgi:inorganic pyrophosphatase